MSMLNITFPISLTAILQFTSSTIAHFNLRYFLEFNLKFRYQPSN